MDCIQNKPKNDRQQDGNGYRCSSSASTIPLTTENVSSATLTVTFAWYLIDTRPQSTATSVAREDSRSTLLNEFNLVNTDITLHTTATIPGSCTEHGLMSQMLPGSLHELIIQFLNKVRFHAIKPSPYSTTDCIASGYVYDLMKAHYSVMGVLGEAADEVNELYETGEEVDCGGCAFCKAGRILSDDNMVKTLLISSAIACAEDGRESNFIKMLKSSVLGKAVSVGTREDEDLVSATNTVFDMVKGVLVRKSRGYEIYNLRKCLSKTYINSGIISFDRRGLCILKGSRSARLK